jgi:hypothetical protein
LAGQANFAIDKFLKSLFLNSSDILENGKKSQKFEHKSLPKFFQILSSKHPVQKTPSDPNNFDIWN